jgi:hypothetical protein
MSIIFILFKFVFIAKFAHYISKIILFIRRIKLVINKNEQMPYRDKFEQ